MKSNAARFLIFLFCNMIGLAAIAQYQCISGGRYDTEIFSNVTITSDITYGSAKTVNNTTQTLTLDIYQPTGDTASKRPMIIWGHGGSFIGGTKNDGDVTTLCTRFAKMGYICVSYNYRLGMGFPINQTNASRAVYRATQDAKAVIRFFRKDASTSNTYKVDPNYIYLGGSSAGAFIALHHAYLDDQAEVPSYIDTTGLGVIEGTSGNPGYPSEVKAIINLCGALGSASWMHSGDEALCSMHGTDDTVVPYATDTIVVLTVPIMVVDGSHTIDSMATTLNLHHVFHTWNGADHVPYASNATYMDSTVTFVRDFLCTVITDTVTQFSNGVQNINSTSAGISLYPNPASDHIFITAPSSSPSDAELRLYDLGGRCVLAGSLSQTALGCGSLAPGFYVWRVSSSLDPPFMQSGKIILEERK